MKSHPYKTLSKNEPIKLSVLPATHIGDVRPGGTQRSTTSRSTSNYARLNYPSEKILFNVFTIWIISSALYILIAEVVTLIFANHENECEVQDHKNGFTFHPKELLILMIAGVLINLIASFRIWLWYNSIKIVGVPLEYMICYLLNWGLFIVGILSLSNTWSKCPNSNPWILCSMFSYHVLLTILLLLMFIKYPWLKQRIVYRKNQLNLGEYSQNG